MAALPYMTFYPSDYLADTAHLSAAQHGAYLLLIMNYWQRGKPLDNTNECLANVARMSNEEWKINKLTLEKFFSVKGNVWFHARIEADLIEVADKCATNSRSGKKSAEVKALRKQYLEENKIDSTNVQRTLSDCSTEDQREANHIKQSKVNNKNNTVDFDSSTKPKSDYDDAFLTFYEAYPLHVSKGKAFAVWKKKKPDLNVCLSAIDAQKKWRESRNTPGVFTAEWKHPSTWLNGECWEDDVSGVNTKTSMIPEGMQQFYDSNGKFIG